MQADHSGPVRLQTFPVTSASTSSPRVSRKMMNPQKALYWAMTNLDVNAVMELLSSPSIDVDERDRACGMQTVLMRLCHLKIHEDERIAILRMILSCNPDMNIKDSSGRTALVHACIAENTEIVQYLSELPECDPSLSDNDGNTPLMYAVRSRKIHVVQTLLRCFYDRLDVNATNNQGLSALAEAESKHDTALCRILVKEGGANPFTIPTIPVSARQTPLTPASSRASSTVRRNTLPPAIHPQRSRQSEVLFSPRSQFTPSRPSSLLGETISDTSSTVLVPLPEESRSHTMPKKNARKKESASEFAGDYRSRGQNGKSRRMKNAHSFPNLQNVNGNLVSGTNSEITDTSSMDRLCAVGPTRDTSEESLGPALPKLNDDEMNNSRNCSEKPAGRRRKGSASLPNLANSTLLRNAHKTFGTDVDNSATESRILEWERGGRTSYRKDADFKLPPLNMTSLTGALASEWCQKCERSRALCACDSGDRKTDESKVGSKKKSGNQLDRMLYLSNEHLAVHSTAD